MAVMADQDLVVDTDDDGTEAGAVYEPSPVKKPKVTVQRTKAATRQAKGLEAPPAAAEVKPAFRRTNDGQCYACGALGHIAAYSTDPEARKRNEEYLARRNLQHKQENEDRAAKSRTAVRAVIARLKDELASRDGERAGRYVSTTRPAMAARRYAYSPSEGGDDDDPGDGFIQGRGEGAQCAAVETSTMANGGHLRCARSSEEGVTVPAKSTASCGMASGELSMHELGAELTDEAFAKFGSVGKVRTALKRSRRADKVRRAARRAARAAGDKMDREVAVLDNDQRVRRQQQCDAARRELNQRRRERYGQERRAINGAQVKLVQRGRVETVSDVCNVVYASDGLPAATMLVGGKRQAVKIDSGARFTVAGTDWMLRGER
ncbi:hypothetical protein PHMEG_00028411, partial [Phytophthora megakarya]